MAGEDAGTRLRPNGRGQQTRDVLLAAARRVFDERGYAAASVTDIAEAAGCSRGGFYRHFEGKRDVLLELVGEMFAALIEVNVTARETAPTAERTEALIAACVEHRQAVRLYLEASEVDPEMHRIRLAARDTVVASTIEWLKTLTGGRLDDEELRIAATAMEGMVVLVIEEWVLRGRAFDPARAAGVLGRLMNSVEAALTDRPPLPAAVETAYGRLGQTLAHGQYAPAAMAAMLEGLSELVEPAP